MRIRRMASAGLLVALIVSGLPVMAAAKEQAHDIEQGNPFHIIGHVLAPVGHLYGYLVVKPFFAIIDALPELFSLK